MRTIRWLALLLLLAPLCAEAAPLYSGTSSFNFYNGDSTTVNWAVYNKGAANPYAVSNDYLYAYTINGWNTNNFVPFTSFNINLNSASGIPISAAGYTSSIGNSLVSITPNTAGSATQLSVFVNGPIFVAGTQVTGWWTSSQAPLLTTSAQMDNGYGPVSGSQAMAAPSATGSAPAPGAPEPHTWELLLALMGLTYLWLHKPRDGYGALQSTPA